MNNIQARARAHLKKIETARNDPRYHRVIGRLVLEKLFFTNRVRPSHSRPTLEEALWVGEEAEPRVLELLPAIVIRRPRLFMTARELPADLKDCIRRLRRDEITGEFRGIPLKDCKQWVHRLGKGQKQLSRLRTHRFTPEDMKVVAQLSQLWNLNETSVIRKALLIALSETNPSKLHI